MLRPTLGFGLGLGLGLGGWGLVVAGREGTGREAGVVGVNGIGDWIVTGVLICVFVCVCVCECVCLRC